MVVMVKLLISCTRGFTEVPSISPTQTLRKHEQWHTPLHEIFLLGGSEIAFQRFSPPWFPGVGYVSRKHSDLECDGADIE